MGANAAVRQVHRRNSRSIQTPENRADKPSKPNAFAIRSSQVTILYFLSFSQAT